MSTAYLDNYLNEIARFALLTAAEEIELSKAIREGEGEAATRAEIKLVEANLRLVVSVAKRWQHTHLNMEELISAGNEGLQIAAKKYDYRKGTRFSTYATQWIEQSIRMAANRAHAVRVPIRRSYQLHKVLTAPSYTEDAPRQNLEQIARETNLKVADIRYVLRNRVTELSLDVPACDGSGESVGGVIAEERCLREELMQSEDLAIVRKALAECLDERQQFVLKQRFGFDGPKATLQAIGDQIGLTHERVRKIEQSALASLRLKLKETLQIALDLEAA
jgi:RNA polymerase primary sigma factor